MSRLNNDKGQISQMGGARPIIIVIQNQGQNSEDFIGPTQSRLIVLDVQDQGRIFEFFIEPTQNCSR